MTKRHTSDFRAFLKEMTFSGSFHGWKPYLLRKKPPLSRVETPFITEETPINAGGNQRRHGSGEARGTGSGKREEPEAGDRPAAGMTSRGSGRHVFGERPRPPKSRARPATKCHTRNFFIFAPYHIDRFPGVGMYRHFFYLPC